MEKAGTVAKLKTEIMPHIAVTNVTLTTLAQAKLFMMANPEKIDEFKQLLNIKRYNTSLIELFLSKQDLSKPPATLLSLDNFIAFCLNSNIQPGAIAVSKYLLKKFNHFIEMINY